jgi:hypothetical protein
MDDRYDLRCAACSQPVPGGASACPACGASEARPAGWPSPPERVLWPPSISGGQSDGPPISPAQGAGPPVGPGPGHADDPDAPEPYRAPPLPTAGPLWPALTRPVGAPAERPEPQSADAAGPQAPGRPGLESPERVASGQPASAGPVSAGRSLPNVIGRAAAPGAARASMDEVRAFRSAGTTYRAGEGPAVTSPVPEPPPAPSPPAPPPAVPVAPAVPVSQPDTPPVPMATRTPGQFAPRTGADSPWAAFARHWTEDRARADGAEQPPPLASAEPAQAGRPVDALGLPGTPPAVGADAGAEPVFQIPPVDGPRPLPEAPAASGAPGTRAASASAPVARATASVRAGSRLGEDDRASAAAAALMPTPRTYRAGGPAQSEPASPPPPGRPPQPPPPPQPPEPPEPPRPPEPPQPAEPPPPAEPPRPHEPPSPPPPGPEPSPFPPPAPPYPPAPTPPGPPYPPGPLPPEPPPPPNPPRPPGPPQPPAPPPPPGPSPIPPPPGPSPIPPPPGPPPAPPYPPPPPLGVAAGAPSGPGLAAAAAYPPHDWRSTLQAAEGNREPVNGASAEYQEWARAWRAGSVYGEEPDQATPAGQLAAALEQSGSLTGHILAQGHRDGPTPASSTTRVILIMILVMGILVVAGIAAATLAGDTVSEIFDNLIHS